MQRKPGFPITNCSIKMPDCPANMEYMTSDEDSEQQQRRQQLINFGHAQWGFNNWSWSVTKQELDFVDFANSKYCAGVVAFVSITVKSFDIHRENIGYATSIANSKGMAIYKSRKCAVTNALRETLLGFGGSVATELLELMESSRGELANPPNPPNPPDPLPENNPNIANRPPDVKSSPVKRKEPVDIGPCANTRSPAALPPKVTGAAAPPAPVVAKAHPMPAAPRPATAPAPAPAPAPRAPPPPALRPNSNEVLKTGFEGMSEEEARAERKRRQRLAQEEFRQKQILKQKTGDDDKRELSKGSSIDKMLMDIPTQDIVIEETASTSEVGKRKSPAADNGPSKKRGSVLSKLSIVQD